MSTGDHDYKWRWSHVDASDHRDTYIALLNHLRPDDDPGAYPHTLPWIDAHPGERLLDVGCGTGAVARAVARHVPGIQHLVAVDNSVRLIEEAQQRAVGKDLPVTYMVADAQRLPFPDASFDRCYATEIFVILPDPRRAFEETVRVTRPGGHLCFWESDCDTRAILGADLALSRRVMRFIGDHEFNGAVARQLIGWLKEVGYEMRITPTVGVMDGPSRLQSVLLPEFLDDAVHAGVVTPEEADAFLSDLRYREEHGLFFAYLVNFKIRARKPVAL